MMRMASLMLTLILTVMVSTSAMAQVQEDGALDELNPFDPNIEQILEEYDQLYQQETGISAIIDQGTVFGLFGLNRSGCYRQECKIWAQVVRSTQKMYLWVDGVAVAEWAISSGAKGYGTPNFDTNPNGRIYDKYSSRKFPGGDYNGLGNMPYAVFISGGFALHGTAKSNWSKLGSPASHGCIRMHPDNALKFNRLVREAGIRNTWITVHE